jgi:ferrous iron transport protein B
LIIYQLGMAFTGHGFGIGTMIALLLTAALVYLLFRPYKEADRHYRTKEIGA